MFSSCKTEFEQIRVSNDPARLYKAAESYYKAEDYLKAQSLYELAIPYYRGKEEAEDLYYKFAYVHYHLGEYILAAHYFNNFSKSFFSSPNIEEAHWMEAYSKYKLSPSFRLDQSHSNDAITSLQNFANLYPESPRNVECNKLIDELRLKMEDKAFDQGKLYYDLKNYNSSIKSFENMLKDFPETKRGEEIRFLILKSSFDWAKNSIYEKKEERFEECITKHTLFLKKYPESKFTTEAKEILVNTQKEIKTLKDVRLKNASTEY